MEHGFNSYHAYRRALIIQLRPQEAKTFVKTKTKAKTEHLSHSAKINT